MNMKKVLGVTLVAVLVLGLSGLATARWGGPGMGMGQQGAMMGPGTGGPGMGMGMGGRAGAGPCMQQGAASVTATAIDETKAKAIASEYVTKNLSGYQVDKLVKFDRPRGSMYQVELKGPKGEVRYLHINPWGNVRDFGTGRTL